jgi:hypothetical protein
MMIFIVSHSKIKHEVTLLEIKLFEELELAQNNMVQPAIRRRQERPGHK